MNPLDGNVDLNPDYVFESRGRLVEGGYEVEIRIPFKSLRYQEAAVQTWGIQRPPPGAAQRLSGHLDSRRCAPTRVS